jgi:hypothetical protein
MMFFSGRAHAPGFLLGALAVLLAPPVASAQWVEAPSTGWAQVQISHQQTEEGFNGEGNVVPLVQTEGDEGESTITTVRFTGALGLVRGVDAWIDVPFHRQEFDTSNPVTEDLLDTGFGDPRVYLRASPALFGIGALPVAVALRGGAKFTSGNFDVDAEAISLSEGQRDWELLLELEKSLHPWPVYIQGWTGYRWRERNENIRRDPGDEELFYVAAGGSVRRFQWKLADDGLLGKESSVRTGAGRLNVAARELVQVIPTIGWQIGPGILQAKARVPIHGQSTRANQLPAAPTVSVGYFLAWDRPLW